ncbi:MAG: hypothetical protein HQK99_15395 [Nitrospirae bacterium]|nr:hypothetical protein [Nitrospirota bacterium]
MFKIRKINNLMIGLSLLASLILVVLTGGMSPALAAATAPDLASNSTYAVTSSTFTNSNLAPYTIINGNICWTTPSATLPTTITGTTLVR